MRCEVDPDVVGAARDDNEGTAATTSLGLVAKIALNAGLIALVGTGAVFAVWPRDDGPPPVVREAAEESGRAEPSGPVAPPLAPAEAKDIGSSSAIAPVAAPRNVAPPQFAQPVLCFGFVRDEAGRPIEGATVTVHTGYEPRPGEIGDGEALVATTTDAFGAYRMTGALPADGAVHLLVRAPGKYRRRCTLTPGRRRDFALGRPGALDVTMRYAGTDRPVVGERLLIERVGSAWHDHRQLDPDDQGRLRLIDLAPGVYRVRTIFPYRVGARVIVEAGKVTALTLEEPGVERVSIRGIVTAAETGEPLPGVSLSLHGSKPRTRPFETDAAGRFALDRVEVGHTISPGIGGVTQLIRGEYYTFHECTRTAEMLDGVKTYALKLERAVVVKVPGRVHDRNGKPIVGARIRPYRGPATESVASDAGGRFTLVGRHRPSAEPDRGMVDVIVEADGFAPGRFDATVALERRGRVRYEADPIDIEMSVGGSLHATLQDASGASLSGASVRLLALRQDGPGQSAWACGTRGMIVGSSVSSASGEVVFDRILPGPHALFVRADGIAKQVVEIGRIEDGERATAVVELRAADLSGVVVDGEGKPMPGVYVTPDDRRPVSAVTAWDGTFHLIDLPAGPLELQARRADCGETCVAVTDRAEPVRIVMQPAATIQGVVLFAEGRAPVRSFRIGYATDGWSSGGAICRDRMGRFKVCGDHGGVRPGNYYITVTASVDGVEWRALTKATVKPGSTTNVVILVHRTVATSGRVVSPDGVPVKDATVEVFPGNDTNRDPITDVRTDEHGRYEVRGLEPGDYLVRARHVQWVEVSRPESIHGDRRLVDIILGRHGATLHVTVRDDEKQPIPNARIDVYRADGSHLAPDRDKYERAYFANKRANPDLTYEAAHRAYTITNAAGQLTRRFLPAGTYRIVAETDTHHAEATATLRPTGQAEVTITLPRPR